MSVLKAVKLIYYSTWPAGAPRRGQASRCESHRGDEEWQQLVHARRVPQPALSSGYSCITDSIFLID
jgi:hypothetical protein